MLYIKTYCYSTHELPFVIANLQEGYDYIDKFYLYEYNYTHTGLKKEYEMDKVLHLIPSKLKNKFIYIKIDLSNYIECSPDNEKICHEVNENIQRSWFFNDKNVILKDDDIIIDCDVDEIIYKNSYPMLLKELEINNSPISIKLNQFFFKHNYLWKNLIFDAPAIYKYKMVKNINKNIKGITCKYQRYCKLKTNNIYGCHMSWVMPIDNMIKKIYSGAHTKYHKFAKKDILEKAISEKKYIFDKNRLFIIEELNINDIKIPQYLRNKKFTDIFTNL